MKTSGMKDSKFLKKEDVGEGVLYTVSGVEQRNVAMPGAEEELKWVLLFEEAEKPLVLNSTNIALCERIFNSDETDDWMGKRIVLYTDPNVSYGGKLVGGIRVRAPRVKTKLAPTLKTQVKQAQQAVAVNDPYPNDPLEEDDSSVPF